MDNSLNDFLKYIFDMTEAHGIQASAPYGAKNRQGREGGVPVCPKCSLRYDDFRRSGKLGCAFCYDAFRPALTAALTNIHGSTVYKGKIPHGRGGQYSALLARREISSLREQLKQAIDTENFEEAVALRDRIRLVESGLEQGPNTNLNLKP